MHSPTTEDQSYVGTNKRSCPENVSDQTAKEPGEELPKGGPEGPQHTLEGKTNNQADQSSNSIPPARTSEQRPQRTRQPPSRPYDKYLWNSSAK